VDDIRESPSLAIIDKLMDRGVNVEYFDPYIPKCPKTRKYNFNLRSVEITKEKINFFDLILLSTDHDIIDYDLIQNEAKLIVDTRGRFRPSKKVFSA